MRSRLDLVLPFSLLVACSSSEPVASSSAPILGGTNDTAHPQVVAIFREAQGASTAEFCSGVLLGPNLVLTAAHCGADVVSSGSGTACFDTPARKADVSGPPADASRFTVVNTQDAYDTAATTHAVTQVVLAPKAGQAPMCGNDLALLVLADAVAGATPAVPRLDAPPTVGESFTAIGYGYDGAQGDGLRRMREGLAVAALGPVGTRATENDWVANQGPCGGDSGSPAFDAKGAIVGIMSRGQPTVCKDMIYTRVDPFADWLRTNAIAAAKTGGYPAPSWAAGGADAGTDAAAPAPASDPGGCNAGGTRPDAGALGLLVALGLALGVTSRARRGTR
jgi:secreted trypsin-like serine protease